jgi:UDP-glucose 4-epimerase
LITGATGYVGRAVVLEFLARGHEVVALVRRSPVDLPPEVELLVGDLDAVPAVEVDGVVHLAARSSVRDSVADPTGVWHTNVTGTLRLLRSLPPGARLVFASTGSVYGTPDRQPIAESAPLAPLNPYGGAKAAAEQLIGWQAATGTLGAISLRIFSAAGAVGGRPDTDTSRIIPRVAAVAAGREPVIAVNGDGGAVRDFVHVADVATAIALALPAATPGTHAIYNVGAVPASVAEIIATTQRVSGRPVAVEHRPANPGEARELRADTSLIRAELGWAPTRTRLEQIVADQWAAAGAAPVPVAPPAQQGAAASASSPSGGQ